MNINIFKKIKSIIFPYPIILSTILTSVLIIETKRIPFINKEEKKLLVETTHCINDICNTNIYTHEDTNSYLNIYSKVIKQDNNYIRKLTQYTYSKEEANNFNNLEDFVKELSNKKPIIQEIISTVEPSILEEYTETIQNKTNKNNYIIIKEDPNTTKEYNYIITMVFLGSLIFFSYDITSKNK